MLPLLYLMFESTPTMLLVYENGARARAPVAPRMISILCLETGFPLE